MGMDSEAYWPIICFLIGWMALFSVMWIFFLYQLRQQKKNAMQAQEALLYRLATLEDRNKRQDEQLRIHEAAVWQQQQQMELIMQDAENEKLQGEAKPAITSRSGTMEPPAQISEKAENRLDAQTEEILRRSRRGQSILEIAKEMDLGQGEVQLVLNLRANARSLVDSSF